MNIKEINSRDTYLYNGQECWTVGRPESDPEITGELHMTFGGEQYFYCLASELESK